MQAHASAVSMPPSERSSVVSMPPSERSAAWGAVLSMSLCVFVLIASEFLPVSLLTPIAKDLAMTEGQAGQAIAVSGIFAVITSLLISQVTARIDRKHVLLSLTGLMGVSGVVVAFAPNYAVFMAGRALLGICIGGFWSMSTATVMRLVPDRAIPKALAILNGGNALAATIAAPLGSFLGAFIGWRGAFFCVVPLAAAALGWQLASLPALPGERDTRSVFRLLGQTKVALGMAATDIVQSGNDVRATVVAETGATETLEADYLIGCDGSHSMVRENAGIARSGTNFDKCMVLIVFRSRDLHEKLKRFPERSTYRVLDPDLHGYWKFFGRVDVGEEFFFHVPVPNNVDRSNFNFNECLFNATGFQFDFEILHAGFWDLRNAVASTYRIGRIFIAGDAAHSHPPYGGYGLNNGLEDAVNLSWKLAACIAGWGSDRLLDSYSAEREPIFREVAEDFIAARIRQDDAFLTRYAPERDRAEFEAAWKARESDVGSRRKAYEPHYDGSAIICGPPEGKTAARGVHSLEARAGHHLSPQVLSSGRNVYEELGRDFTLIALGADAAGGADAFEQAARSRNIPLKIARETALATRENYGSPLILVRPDQHIAWVGEAAEDEDGIMQKVVGQ